MQFWSVFQSTCLWVCLGIFITAMIQREMYCKIVFQPKTRWLFLVLVRVGASLAVAAEWMSYVMYICVLKNQEPNDSLVSMLFYFSIFLKRPLLWPLSWLFPWSSFLVVIRWTWCWNICLKATAVATTVVVRLVKSYLEATTPKNWILASLGTTPTTSTKQMSMCTQLLRNVVTWHWRHWSAPRRWPLHCLCQKFKSCFNWWVVREFVETGVCKRALTYGLFYFLSIQYQSFFVAGTTSAFVCFILPAAFVLKLQQTKRLQLTTGEWWLSWCLASGGCVVGVLSTYVTLYNLIDSGRHN